MYFSPVFKHYFIMKSQCVLISWNYTVYCITQTKYPIHPSYMPFFFLSFECHQSVKKDTGLSVALLTSTESMVLTKAIVSFTTPWTYKQTTTIIITFHLNFYKFILSLFYLQTVKNYVYCAHAASTLHINILSDKVVCHSNVFD